MAIATVMQQRSANHPSHLRVATRSTALERFNFVLLRERIAHLIDERNVFPPECYLTSWRARVAAFA